jgi:hypothetical protein
MLGAAPPPPPSKYIPKSPIYAGFFVRQNIGALINPVVPSFLIVPIFWSLWLSGRSGYPVILVVFWSFL